MDYHAELHLNRGTNVGVAWRFDVLNDRGELVHEAIARGTAAGREGDSLSTSSVGVDLSDGFYALRVRAAVASEEVSDVLEAVQYVEIDQGYWRELSADDWYAESAYTLALPLPATVQLPRQEDTNVTPGGEP